MVLVDSMGNTGLCNRLLVLSMKGDGSGVVMNAPCVQFELLDDVECQTEEETPRPARCKGIEAPCHTIVVDRVLLR